MKNQQNTQISAISPRLFDESLNDGHHCLVMTHVYWTTQLRFAMTNNETLDVNTIAKDNCCGLGEWLHVKHAHLRNTDHPAYHDCVAKHAAFHLEASKIAELIISKRYEDARQLFDCTSQFDHAYNAAAAALIRLKKEINVPLKVIVAIKPARRIGLNASQLSFRFPISA
jgi:methyl-accepting chemotaxis protein